MNRALLLSLLLLACDPPGDTDSDAGADGGSTDDGGRVHSADCRFLSLAPLTTSWSGGETLRVTLSCADTSALGAVSLLLRPAELDATIAEVVSVDGEIVPGEVTVVDEVTAEARFTAPAQPGTGPRRFALEVDGREIDGDVVRFRRDPPGIGDLSRVEAEPALLEWGPRLDHAERCPGEEADGTAYRVTRLVSLDRESGDALYGRARDGDLQSSASASLGGPVIGFEIDSDDFCPKVTDPGRAGEPSTTVVAVLREDAGGSPTLSLASFTDTDGELTVTELTDPGGALAEYLQDVDADAPHLRVDATTDPGGAVTGLEVAAVSSFGRTPRLAVLSGLVEGGGRTSWTQRWNATLPDRPLHVSPRFTREDGSEALAVFTQTTTGVHVTVYGAESGAIAAEGPWSGPTGVGDLTTAVVDHDDDGTDELLIAALDADGEVHTGAWEQSLGATIRTSAAPVVVSPRSSLELRATSRGDVHLVAEGGDEPRVPPPYVAGGEISVGAVVATWTPGGDAAADITEAPDRAELVTRAGTAVGGAADRELAGALDLYFGRLGTAGLVGPYVAATIDADADTADRQLVLAAAEGWQVYTEAGGVYLRDPDGATHGEALSLDPMRQVELGFDEAGVVVLGTLLSTDGGSGETVRAPGIVTLRDGALESGSVAVEAAHHRWTHVAVSHAERRMGVYLVSSQTDAAGTTTTAVSWIDWGPEDVPGVAIDTDGGFAVTWDTSLGDADVLARTVSAAALAERTGTTNLDGSAPSDVSGSSVLATLDAENVLPDLFVTLPNTGDEACPVATYFVPGASADPSTNAASMVRVATSDLDDCADLAVPVATASPRGGADSAVILVSSDVGALRRVDQFTSVGYQVVTPGRIRLVQTPAIATPGATQVRSGDLDGDGFGDLYLTLSAEPEADGSVDPTLSGLVLRSQGGSWYGDVASRPDGSEGGITLTPSDLSSGAATLPDEGGMAGAAVERNGVDAAVITGTTGHAAEDGNGRVLDRLDFYITGVE